MIDPDQVRLVILLTFFGFIALAVALLLPVYLFMRREEKRGLAWNEELYRQGRLTGSEPPAPPDGTPLVERDKRT